MAVGEPSETRAGWNAFDIQARKVVYQIMNVDNIAIRAMESGNRSAIRSWISQLQQLVQDTKPLWKNKIAEADVQIERLKLLNRVAWAPGYRLEGANCPDSKQQRRLELLEAIHEANGAIVNGIQDGYLYQFKRIKGMEEKLDSYLKIFGKKSKEEETDVLPV